MDSSYMCCAYTSQYLVRILPTMPAQRSLLSTFFLSSWNFSSIASSTGLANAMSPTSHPMMNAARTVAQTSSRAFLKYSE